MADPKTKFKPSFGDDIATPVGRIAFPHLAKPDTEGQYASHKYKGTLLFAKGTNLQPLKQACIDLIKSEKAWKGQGLKMHDFDLPFRDGDDKPQYEDYPGNLFIVCKTKKRPYLVDRQKTPIDPDDIYPGAHVRFVVTPMTYESTETVVELVEEPDGTKRKKKVTQTSRGVTLLLKTVQFVKDGERMGGGGSGLDKLDELDDEVMLEDDEPVGDGLDDDDDVVEDDDELY